MTCVGIFSLSLILIPVSPPYLPLRKPPTAEEPTSGPLSGPPPPEPPESPEPLPEQSPPLLSRLQAGRGPPAADHLRAAGERTQLGLSPHLAPIQLRPITRLSSPVFRCEHTHPLVAPQAGGAAGPATGRRLQGGAGNASPTPGVGSPSPEPSPSASPEWTPAASPAASPLVAYVVRLHEGARACVESSGSHTQTRRADAHCPI